MANEATTGQRTFGIGAVARLTGLTDHTIRVWERRYNAVVAGRAANGRRTYKAGDIEKLKLLKLLTDHGLTIGRIAAESTEQLAARARELRSLATGTSDIGEIRVAIFGELLPALIKTEESSAGPLSIIVSDSLEDRFVADLEQQSVDVLVVELPVIGAETARRVERLKVAAGTDRVVCIYSFAQSADAAALREDGVVMVRAPVTIDEAVQAVIRAAGDRQDPYTTSIPKISEPDERLDEEGPVEARLFSQQQLAALANTSSTIECECPQHLAELVGALSAFEIYSANCASRNKDDAALHRFLHRRTAHARSLIEQALERVAREEGLI